MPNELVRFYFGRSPEAYGRRWVLRSYVPEQLYERIYVCICLQFWCSSGWIESPIRPDFALRKLRHIQTLPARHQENARNG